MSDVTLQFRSTLTGDDGYWKSGTFNNSATQLILGNVGGALYNFFILFKNTIIPKGATIISAYLRFSEVSASSSGTTEANIYVNDTTTPVAPTNESEANALVLSSAVAWTSPKGDSSSVDIKSIIQILVDKLSWDIDKSLMLVIKNNGSANDNYKTISSFDAGAALLPALEVTWTLPSDWMLKNSGVSADDGFAGSEQAGGYEDYFDNAAIYVRFGTDWVGSSQNIPMSYKNFMRFPNVVIPNANIISHAYLIGVTNRANPNFAAHPLNDTVYFNDVDDAAAPANKTQVNALALTSASGTWQGHLALTGRTYNSGDIAAPLQEIVNREGWASGQAVMPVVVSNQVGAAYTQPYADIFSYDNGSKYPLLLINHAPIPLAITSFTPTIGPVGTPVTITGTGFTSAPTVRFYQNIEAVVDSYLATQIETSVPENAITGPISVTVG